MDIREFCGVNSIYERPDGTQLTHEEVYGRIVNEIGLQTCIRYVPATREEIREALNEDPYLNNIPLRKWDDQHQFFKQHLVNIGINVISLSDTVCTQRSG